MVCLRAAVWAGRRLKTGLGDDDFATLTRTTVIPMGYIYSANRAPLPPLRARRMQLCFLRNLGKQCLDCGAEQVATHAHTNNSSH